MESNIKARGLTSDALTRLAQAASRVRNVKRARSVDGYPRTGRVSRDEIAGRAYELYLARGAEPGHDLDDWLQAERELCFPSPQG